MVLRYMRYVTSCYGAENNLSRIGAGIELTLLGWLFIGWWSLSLVWTWRGSRQALADRQPRPARHAMVGRIVAAPLVALAVLGSIGGH